MLSIELDNETGIAIVKPEGALAEKDFDAIAAVIDPYLDKHEELAGLIISTQVFPGWKTFGSFVQHFKFVKQHHRKLSHVALVTDSEIGNVAEKIAGHFVSAKVKHFPYDELVQAKNWVLYNQ